MFNEKKEENIILNRTKIMDFRAFAVDSKNVTKLLQCAQIAV